VSRAPKAKKPPKKVGWTVEYASIEERIAEEDRMAALEADAAALREVLEDCHIHNEYVRVGSDHADRLKKLKYYGRPHDRSAAEHETAVGMALSGGAGKKLLAEVRDYRDGKKPAFDGETLLQRRKKQLDEAVEDLLTRADTLRKCRDGGYSDVNSRVADVESAAREAARFAALVEDLDDVEKYGPGGGR
jgi:hypothetical protein